MVQLIAISGSSYNGSSTLLCAITIISFFFLVASLQLKIYNKLYPNSPNSLDIINVILNGANTILNIKNYMKIWSKDGVDKGLSEYTDKIKTLNQGLDNFNTTTNIVSEVVAKTKTDIYNNFYDRLNTMNDFLDNLQNVFTKIKDINDNNIANLKTIYINYIEKIKKYTDDLVNMLNTIAYQISQATVTPALNIMIKPFYNVFTSISETLQTNLPFIQTYYTNFKLNIPKVDMTVKSNLASNFKTSKSILTTSGFK